MKLAIGSDKSGFPLKAAIKAYLQSEGIAFDDLGTTDLDHVKPFYVVSSTIAPLIQSGAYDRAILICGTGAGVSVVANKFKGVTAVACESLYAAKMCRAINDANVLCMGGWLIAPEMGIEMTKAFLQTAFLQDLEEWRKDWLTNAKREVGALEDRIYD